MAAPSDADKNQPLSNQTLRMIIAPHLAGQTLRIHLSNRFGSAPVTLGPVTIGILAAGASLRPGSERSVTFSGSRAVRIAPGADAISDSVKLKFAAFEDLAISVYVPGKVSAPTEHADTRQTNYLSPSGSGDHAKQASGLAFSDVSEATGWYFLDGLDVSGARTGRGSGG